MLLTYQVDWAFPQLLAQGWDLTWGGGAYYIRLIRQGVRPTGQSLTPSQTVIQSHVLIRQVERRIILPFRPRPQSAYVVCVSHGQTPC